MNALNKFLNYELHLDPQKYLNDFIIYEELLLEWNKKINLVSRRSRSIEEHILNSIFFLTKYNLEGKKNIIDIGSGGGFPGIPLKILFPGIELTLLDSIKKKVNVLNDIIEKMNLKKIKAVCGRAEICSKEPKFENKFDVVISKAVSNLYNLFFWGKDFLKPGGEILCIKGGEVEEEINSLNNLKYNFDVKVINFALNKPYKIEDKKLVIIKFNI